ncbi:c-type cytochrome [Acidovorax sp. GBBC 3334]|uniref:c-type cytochrome n=1 Tax=Acidovorax sp. GBBC 3334 TaxID=2940496 RepID=UPI0023041F83|nr:c-type cytochrome [Acidovorax sp. GBBC 3334]MDA8456820.1 c-type cytochrome [Acidovorax sp. GBBC 3334]
MPLPQDCAPRAAPPFLSLPHGLAAAPIRRWPWACLLALAGALGGAPGGAPIARAQPSAPQQGPAAAPSEQSVPSGMVDRVIACTACHGREGRATQQGYFPRIAGKPAGYLYHQLLHFRDGRRSYPQMSYLLEHMTDDYLREIAGHFAALDLPYAPPPPPQAPPEALERGRRLVREGDAARGIPACVQCHGGAMTGVQPSIPGLVGLPRDYLNSQIGAWQTGQRRSHAPDCMARVARQLTAEDVSAISAWLAAQPVPGTGKPAATAGAPLPMPCGGVDAAAQGAAP